MACLYPKTDCLHIAIRTVEYSLRFVKIKPTPLVSIKNKNELVKVNFFYSMQYLLTIWLVYGHRTTPTFKLQQTKKTILFFSFFFDDFRFTVELLVELPVDFQFIFRLNFQLTSGWNFFSEHFLPTFFFKIFFSVNLKNFFRKSSDIFFPKILSEKFYP